MTKLVPRVAAVHDLAGFGRSSLAVVTPILSAMGVQVCALPTAVLSTHSRFPSYRWCDLTGHMQQVVEHWSEVGVEFDAVYTGFLGAPEQVDVVTELVDRCSSPERLLVVDPVLGDNGALYRSVSPDMVGRMRELTERADVITPNVTEASLLLGERLPPALGRDTAVHWLRRLAGLGPRIAVLTSVRDREAGTTAALCYDRRTDHVSASVAPSLPTEFPGTGDVFTSVLTGALLRGAAPDAAVEQAVDFVVAAMRVTIDQGTPPDEGILLEHVLGRLSAKPLGGADI